MPANIDVQPQDVRLWHAMDLTATFDALETSASGGLSVATAMDRLARYGPNKLPESEPKSALSMFVGQFNSFPVFLLVGAAVLSVFTGGVADAIVICSVIVINAVIGFVTEAQAEKTINSLKGMVRPHAQICREGVCVDISAEEVVPGDFLLLRPGTYISADARIIDSRMLSVDESALTGESMPVLKSAATIDSGNVPLADRINMVYMGTLVTGGQGAAVVVATGEYTEIGLIQTLVGEATTPDTPMEKQLVRMGNQLVMVSGAVCGLVLLTGILRGYSFIEMVKSSISLAVAAIPEGLPAVATTVLAIGINKMKKQKVLIRHLEAVETLGSIQTICLDKTGTITLNRMTVVRIRAGLRNIKVAENRLTCDGAAFEMNEEVQKLLYVITLCSETEIVKSGTGDYMLNGSSTENSLVQTAINAGVDVWALRESFPLLDVSHRAEDRNYMVTTHMAKQNGGNGHNGSDNGSNGFNLAFGIGTGRLIAVKGTPMEVLDLCGYHLSDGQRLPLSLEDRHRIRVDNEQMAGKALRVLGVAYGEVGVINEDTGVISEDAGGINDGVINENSGSLSSLTWLGLVGMVDPVRKEAKRLIDTFHKAGIETVMITGDQVPTAFAVGRKLNLSMGGQLEIMDSTHLDELAPEVLKAVCEKVQVFARVSPAHKLQVVQALQKAGKVIAMTGDGINDGPALKAADIGIAMGNTGTDVAREVADIILEDDNLETMIIAVSHGRTIYNNIRKSIHYLLSTNMSEIMVMFLSLAGGMGHPLSAMQLLWINLISDIFPGIALSLEPPEPDVMERPPRPADEPLFDKARFRRMTFESAALSASTLGAYGYGLSRYGISPQSKSIAFMSLSMSQLIHAYTCRSEKQTILGGEKLPTNKYLNIAVGGSMLLQLLVMVVPPLRNLLGVTPLKGTDAVVAGASALVPLIINESTKKLFKGGSV
ncbi:MAG: cation-transporting P-type ATPase [Nitrospirae bacterium]|nr:cation-transporting P-type ATPase [Nitrospirota bacterium]